MPRRKISEYRAKNIIADSLNVQATSWEFSGNEIRGVVDLIHGYDRYVVKVDQAVKGRFKKGLVVLDVPLSEMKAVIAGFKKKGYEYFLVEPYLAHDTIAERYLCITQDRQGIHLNYSVLGGVDIEKNPTSIESYLIDTNTKWEELSTKTALSVKHLKSLIKAFRENYFVFLEINPYISDGTNLSILDCAVEVDDSGLHLVRGWSEADIRHPMSRSISAAEKEVYALDANSPASFNLSVLNPNGSIFLLLSGGGASVVVADEIYNRGYGMQLANYGEYSGNPTTDETFVYTNQLLKLILASSATSKVLFIGGAVANFTNIANTFAGIIQALSEYAEELLKQGVKVYVRRGGPYQEIGLAKIRLALESYGLLGGVYDPSTSITDALQFTLEGMKND